MKVIPKTLEEIKIVPKTYEAPCISLAHNPPNYLALPANGQYIHTCPNCGKRQIVKNIQVTLTYD